MLGKAGVPVEGHRPRCSSHAGRKEMEKRRIGDKKEDSS